MNILKSNTLIERAITPGIPLLMIAVYAQLKGVEVASVRCVVMAVLAAAIQTALSHFLVEPKRQAHLEAGTMGSFYNLGAVFSCLATFAAVVLVSIT
jgi:hypothetical protein